MNNHRRERLREALRLLSKCESIVDSICDQEQDSLDNIPENLQGTDRYEKMESAVDTLNDALEKIDEVRSHVEAALI